jgi:hypothetical protein
MANIDPFVDILTVIDAQRLMDDHPDASPDTVSSLGSDPGEYVYMLVTRAEVIGIEAGYELNVAVKTGDLVRWRATSLTRNTGSAPCCTTSRPTAARSSAPRRRA